MNFKWNYQPPIQEQIEAAKALARKAGISPILGKLLLKRGITSAAEAKRFFRPQLNELHDPFLMKDMSAAVERLNLGFGVFQIDAKETERCVLDAIKAGYRSIDTQRDRKSVV